MARFNSKRCLEFFVQVAAMMASTGALVAAILTQLKLSNLTSAQRAAIEVVSKSLGQDEVLLKSQITAALVFLFVAVLILIGFVALFGRMYNARHDKNSTRIFTVLYLLFALFCFLGFAAAGILGVLASIDLSNIFSRLQEVTLPPFEGSLEVIENLLDSLIATSACSFLAAVLFLLLDVVVLVCCAAVKRYSNYVDLTDVYNHEDTPLIKHYNDM